MPETVISFTTIEFPNEEMMEKTYDIFYREMKSLAAILGGPIQYIEIPQWRAFFIDDYWNVMNDQHETE